MARMKSVISVVTLLFSFCVLNQFYVVNGTNESILAQVLNSTVGPTSANGLNASEYVSEIHVEDSNDEGTRVIIDFNLPVTRQSSDSNNINQTVANDPAAPIFQLVINQPDEISINQTESHPGASTDAIAITTETTATTAKTTTASSTTTTIATTTNPQQLLIPPASVNATIAQMSDTSPKHKQGQIIIR